MHSTAKQTHTQGELTMPYHSLNDLPDSVKDTLPKHAQEIYMKAFNSAYDKYNDPKARRGRSSREATAHKVAWSAVENTYEKKGGEWKPKEH
jgi:cation transport regulator